LGPNSVEIFRSTAPWSKRLASKQNNPITAFTIKEIKMFSHVMLGVNDLEVSKKFYDALLGTLGYGPGVANKNRYFYRSPTGTFAISTPINGEPANHGNGSTIGFTVKSPEQGDAFHAAGIANGGTTCEDPPGFREGPAGKLYLAYLRDPDGNKICALHRPSST
jgi:catechol 2,3-dioxygenase-like lactoylglutathione lyase family enzyme